jgi:hypothetical protein
MEFNTMRSRSERGSAVGLGFIEGFKVIRCNGFTKKRGKILCRAQHCQAKIPQQFAGDGAQNRFRMTFEF